MNNILISEYFLLMQNIFTFFSYTDDDSDGRWDEPEEGTEEADEYDFYPKEDRKKSKENKKPPYGKEEENLPEWELGEEDEPEEEGSEEEEEYWN